MKKIELSDVQKLENETLEDYENQITYEEILEV